MCDFARELERENAKLLDSHAAIHDALKTQEADHTKWPNQIIALREDRERLDFLIQLKPESPLWNRIQNYADVRKSIDAARKEETK